MLVVKEKEVSKLTEQLQALQEEGQNDSATLEAAEQHFKAVSAGLSTNEDGEEATLAGQMMTCKNDMSKADTEAKQVSGGQKFTFSGWHLGCSLIFSCVFFVKNFVLTCVNTHSWLAISENIHLGENTLFLTCQCSKNSTVTLSSLSRPR